MMKVRLVTEDNKSIIVSKERAIEIANESNLSLIEVAKQKDIIVYKLGNIGKFNYKKKKKEKENKKKTLTFEVKEIKIKPAISDNDLMIKIEMAKRFLSSGNKVKITVFNRAKKYLTYSAKVDKWNEIKNKIVDNLNEISSFENKNDGKILIITPTKCKK